MLCLLRLVEPELEGENKKGPIIWDGVDTSKLTLNTLRTKIGTCFVLFLNYFLKKEMIIFNYILDDSTLLFKIRLTSDIYFFHGVLQFSLFFDKLFLTNFFLQPQVLFHRHQHYFLVLFVQIWIHLQSAQTMSCEWLLLFWWCFCCCC